MRPASSGRGIVWLAPHGPGRCLLLPTKTYHLQRQRRAEWTSRQVRLYGSNGAGLATYRDTPPITLDETPPRRHMEPCEPRRYPVSTSWGRQRPGVLTWIASEARATLQTCWSAGGAEPIPTFRDDESPVVALNVQIARWGRLEADNSTISWGLQNAAWEGERGDWYSCGECDVTLQGLDMTRALWTRNVSLVCDGCLDDMNVVNMSVRAVNIAGVQSSWLSTIFAVDTTPPRTAYAR